MRSAFTLIELMIAITLGMMVVAVAAAGFKVASSSIVAAQRLTLENQLIGAGITIAWNDADFWTSYDDPDSSATSAKRLRQLDTGADTAVISGTRRMGLPFTPFGGTNGGWPRAGGHGTGWDPDPTKWSAGHPERWWRGNIAERGSTDLRFGRYAMFAASREPGKAATDTIALRSNTLNWTAWWDQPITPVGNYGTVRPAYGWLYHQFRGASDGVGYYGLMDYMPPNMVYSYYREWVEAYVPGRGWKADATNNGGIAYHALRGPYYPGWAGFPGYQLCDWYPLSSSQGLYRLTFGSGFSLVAANQTTATWDVRRLTNEHRKYFWFDANASQSSALSSAEETSPATPTWALNQVRARDQYLESITTRMPLLAQRPSHWPDVTASVSHFVYLTRFGHLCQVSWVSPLTGETLALSFCTFSTTLRGARQQRGLDSY